MAVKVEGEGEIYNYLVGSGSWLELNVVLITRGVQLVRPREDPEAVYRVAVTDNGDSVDGPQLPSQRLAPGSSFNADGLVFSHTELTTKQVNEARIHQGMLINPSE